MTDGLRRPPRFIDQEDMVQEALCHLWERWNRGELADKTESYILTSCRFHLQNYLRKVQEKMIPINLYAPIDSRGTTLEELIPDRSFSPEQMDAKVLVEQIRGDGLTKREKEVFELRLQGYTVRQVGERLGISHPRVIRLLSNIRHKWKDRMEI
jgi:RNA polymerase sigma factor (sigma-70 family)